MSDLVVKTNRLNTVIQSLSVSEIRLVQLAIVDCRETNTGLTADKPLSMNAQRFADVFGIDNSTAYECLKSVSKSLLKKQFRFIDQYGDETESNWVQECTYKKNQGCVDILFTSAVVKEVTRLDGNEQKQIFTKYMLENTSSMKSHYSIRLYELIVQWLKIKKTPIFELEKFRKQLGLNSTEYLRMSDFKRRVLDVAVNEINTKSDIKVTYDQIKQGRIITGFKFDIKEKTKPKKLAGANDKRDKKTVDMFNGLTDSQLERVTRSQKFMNDYGFLVHATSPANRSMKDWTFEMVKKIKEDPRKFTKKPMQEYLDDEPAKQF